MSIRRDLEGRILRDSTELHLYREYLDSYKDVYTFIINSHINKLVKEVVLLFPDVVSSEKETLVDHFKSNLLYGFLRKLLKNYINITVPTHKDTRTVRELFQDNGLKIEDIIDKTIGVYNSNYMEHIMYAINKEKNLVEITPLHRTIIHTRSN